MTNDQREIRRKLRILEHAAASGDVSRTCRCAVGTPQHLFRRRRQASLRNAPVQASHGAGQEPSWSQGQRFAVPVGPFHYAYHYDQAQVGRYLRKKSSGIAMVDGTVAGVRKDSLTGAITALKLEEGGMVRGDFFIDATGFRKRLIGQEMGGAWHSYRAELPVNRAMPF